MYYMNKGQNVGRELAAEVSNPRTPAQMRQRMKWANLVNVYKANRLWMGHLSFENKKQTWSDYNAFMSANIGTDPVYLTKSMVEEGSCFLAPYTMTKGSLVPIEYDYAASANGLETNISIPDFDNDSTIGDLSTDILDHNSDWRVGDQLSIIMMFADAAHRPIVCPIEIILDPTDTRNLGEVGTIYANLDEILSAGDDDNMTIDLTGGHSFPYQGGCIVHSRTISGRTYVSTQAFCLNVEAMLLFQQMGTDEQFQTAAATYGVGDDYFLAAGYQDTEGGGGSTFAIRSVNLTFTDPDLQVTSSTKYPNDNNFSYSSMTGCTNITFTYDINVDLTGVDPADIVVDFVPTGGTAVNLSESGTAAISAGKIIVSNVSATAADNSIRVAGSHVITLPDAREASLSLKAY